MHIAPYLAVVLRPTHLSLRVTAETWEGLSEKKKHKMVRKCFVVDPAERQLHQQIKINNNPQSKGRREKKPRGNENAVRVLARRTSRRKAMM